MVVPSASDSHKDRQRIMQDSPLIVVRVAVRPWLCAWILWPCVFWRLASNFCRCPGGRIDMVWVARDQVQAIHDFCGTSGGKNKIILSWHQRPKNNVRTFCPGVGSVLHSFLTWKLDGQLSLQNKKSLTTETEQQPIVNSSQVFI